MHQDGAPATFAEAQDLIDHATRIGFYVAYDHRVAGGCRSHRLSGPHECPFSTEEAAWQWAAAFSRVCPDRFVNIYVVDLHYRPVRRYYERILNHYPG